MFTNVDLSLIQKKVLENPKVSLGAAGVGVAAIALIYALTKSSSNGIDDEIDGLPEYARYDVDNEFTQRFAKNRNRKRTISDHHRRKRRGKPIKTGNHMTDRNNKKNEEKKDMDIDDSKDIKYSLLDPNNPNYSYDMNFDQENEDENSSEAEEGFSADQYYVPFRVNNAKTKRKPDAPFMAMFKMYANAPNTGDPSDEMEMNMNENKQTEMNNNNNNEEEEEEEDEKEERKEHIVDDDIGSSPPLNPHIPSHHNIGTSVLNPLDNLRERYYKKELPRSLQPTSLSNAFSSETQKAIQNDLNADDSLLGGIKQSVQMITQSND